MVVDDHEIVRRGIADYLDAMPDFSVVGEAATGEDAISSARELIPSVVILDVRLGEDNGIEVCREIKSENPDMKVLMFTSFADGDALEAAIMAGATGYLLKRIALDELAEAVRAAVRGEALMDPEAAEILQRRMEGGVSDELAKLSPQERNVLKLIAEGMTNRQIAEELDLAEKTVKNYVSNLLRKLDMRRRSEAAAYRASLDAE
jgi:RNA polymerase sigma factor (sigma-70 family)